MKISCVQMDMHFCAPDENFQKARQLILQAAQEQPDVIVLPETWNTGFFPKEQNEDLFDRDGTRVKEEIGGLAKHLKINIVAGSVSNLKNGKLFNTAYVFDREGTCVAEYDKTHLFTPMKEHEYYQAGDHVCRFQLDGVKCGLIICYDIRFPELTRTMSVQQMDLMFVVSQWPSVRAAHLKALCTARAIENQMFVACCNSCGAAEQTQYAGNSMILDPWGQMLAMANEHEQILSASCDFSVLQQIRTSINVFSDRRPELYTY